MEQGIILNGTTPLAVAKNKDVIHRLEPIQEYTPITITDLKKGVPYIIDLSKHLEHDYFINQAVFDLPSDDSKRLEDYDGEVKDKQLLRVFIKPMENGVITSDKLLIMWSTQSNIPGIFLSKNQKILIQANEDASSLTFYGRPILLNKTISLTKEVTFNGDSEPTTIESY